MSVKSIPGIDILSEYLIIQSFLIENNMRDHHQKINFHCEVFTAEGNIYSTVGMSAHHLIGMEGGHSFSILIS